MATRPEHNTSKAKVPIKIWVYEMSKWYGAKTNSLGEQLNERVNKALPGVLLKARVHVKSKHRAKIKHTPFSMKQ